MKNTESEGILSAMTKHATHMDENEIDALLNEEHIVHAFCNVTDSIYDDPSCPKLYMHHFFEIGVIVSGNGIHRIAGESIPCKTNDLYILPPNTPHRYYVADSEDPLVIRKLYFRPEKWFRGDVAVAGNNRYCYGVFKDGDALAYAMLDSYMQEKLANIMDSIESELVDKEQEWQTVIQAYLTQFFVLVSRYINRSVKNIHKKSKDWKTVCSTIHIVEAEFSNCDLSLAAIAKRVYVSQSHLSRIFKTYTGQLFSEYIRRVRLNHAAELLKNDGLTVGNIVSQCGLRDISAFYGKFREMFGMTPQIYRKMVKLSLENSNKKNNNESEKKMELLREISTNIQCGKAKIVKELVQKAIDEGVKPAEILNEGLLDGMSVIGEKFKNNEVYVPEVLVAARAMNMGTQILKPYLASEGVGAIGKVCIGTVQGDLHDIGKNLVKMMMEGKGLEVIDLGTDVSPETFIQNAIDQDCRIICCSALLTTTMGVMNDVVKAAEAAGIRDKVKIMVGGAPVSEAFCQEIGADVYTVDAASAADAAVELCKM